MQVVEGSHWCLVYPVSPITWSAGRPIRDAGMLRKVAQALLQDQSLTPTAMGAYFGGAQVGRGHGAGAMPCKIVCGVLYYDRPPAVINTLFSWGAPRVCLWNPEHMCTPVSMHLRQPNLASHRHLCMNCAMNHDINLPDLES